MPTITINNGTFNGTITYEDASTPPVDPPPGGNTAKVDACVKQNTVGASNSEGFPNGVPHDWDWYKGKPNSPQNVCPPDWTQITGWSQIYAMEGQPFVSGTFTVANMQCWCRNKQTGVWTQVQLQATNKIYGASYPGNFVGSAISWTFTLNADKSQTGNTPQNGRNVHWYHTARADFAPNIYDHCYVQLDTKVSASNMNWVVNAGADWYPNPQTVDPGEPGSDAVPGAGQGNWIKPTTSYRTSYLYTCTEAEFRANLPPPLR